MLNKRYQVLINDWMEEYINLVSKGYDLNFSATIRIHLCLAIIFIIKTLYPEYKPNLQDKELQELARKASKNELEEAEAHKMISKILFEARKAVEFRLSKA
ncbi:MAG: hypothetical protein ACETWK_06375 [Candidatus Aminicenantaceae bacterium]